MAPDTHRAAATAALAAASLGHARSLDRLSQGLLLLALAVGAQVALTLKDATTVTGSVTVAAAAVNEAVTLK